MDIYCPLCAACFKCSNRPMFSTVDQVNELYSHLEKEHKCSETEIDQLLTAWDCTIPSPQSRGSQKGPIC